MGLFRAIFYLCPVVLELLVYDLVQLVSAHKNLFMLTRFYLYIFIKNIFYLQKVDYEVFFVFRFYFLSLCYFLNWFEDSIVTVLE
jgi:hypothetical protein